MSETIVREATEKDIERLATIQVETWRCAYKGNVSSDYLNSLSVEHRKGRWTDILKQTETTTYMGVYDGVVAGFCNVGVCRDKDSSTSNGELLSMYVDQHFMNRGVGSALMNKAKESLKAKGFKSATLWVFIWNNKSRHFYEKHGWTSDGTEKKEERSGELFHEIRYRIDFIS